MGAGMPLEGEARSLSTVGGRPADRSRPREWDEIPMSVALPVTNRLIECRSDSWHLIGSVTSTPFGSHASR